MYEKECVVYIMTNSSNTVLYTGVTSSILSRVQQHRDKLIPGFTAKYNVTKLVYLEYTNDIVAAIEREKVIKGWLRAKKIDLIESINPDWKDLAEDLF